MSEQQLENAVLADLSDVVDELHLPKNTPSPREIRKRSFAIQKTWTEQERTRASGALGPQPVEYDKPTSSRAIGHRRGGLKGDVR